MHRHGARVLQKSEWGAREVAQLFKWGKQLCSTVPRVSSVVVGAIPSDPPVHRPILVDCVVDCSLQHVGLKTPLGECNESHKQDVVIAGRAKGRWRKGFRGRACSGGDTHLSVAVLQKVLLCFA